MSSEQKCFLTLSNLPSATTAVAVEEDNCVRLGGDSGSGFAALANNTWSVGPPVVPQ